MSRKFILTILAALMLVSMATLGTGNSAVRAQNGATTPASTQTSDDDFDVRIEISGIIQSITPQSPRVSIVLLTDGTSILVNPASDGSANLVPGQTVTIVASMDDGDDQLVAKIIAVVILTPEPTEAATVEPTVEATMPATLVATLAATPAVTQQASCGGNNQQPVATRLADAFGVSYDEIMGWHCQGFGFGEIAKAYLLAAKTGKTPDEFFGMRKAGKGWGQIVKGEGVKPSDLAPGQVIKGKKHDTIIATASANDNSDQNTKPGKGNGNGNGKENGNGKGNDKGNGGKGNGKGSGKK